MATAEQQDISVPFPYIAPDHVKVRANGVTLEVLEWVTETTLRLAFPLAAGTIVLVYRDTPIDNALVTYNNGAVLTEEDLNLAVKQLLFKQQELVALYNRSLSEAQIRLANNMGLVVSPEDVAQELAQLVLEQDVINTLTQRIADIDANSAAILDQAVELEEIRTVVDALGAITDGEGIATLIANEQAQRIAGDTAISQTISLIGAKNAENNAFIVDLNTTKVSSTETLAQRFTNIQSAAAADATAKVTSEATTRANADAVFANNFTLLGAKNGAGTAWVLNDATVQLTGGATLASTLSGITTSVSGVSAALATEQTARINGDNALTSQVTTLSSTLGNPTTGLAAAHSRITSEETARIAGVNAVAARATALESTVNSSTTGVAAAHARITAEETARASADSAFSSQITTIQASITSNPNLAPDISQWVYNAATVYQQNSFSRWGPAALYVGPRTTVGELVVLNSADITIDPNVQYTVSADILLQATGSAYCYIDGLTYNASGTMVQDLSGSAQVPAQDFSDSRARTSFSFTAASTATKLRIRFVIGVNSGGSVTSAGIRRIKLERGSVATAYNESASVAQVQVTAQATANAVTGLQAKYGVKVSAGKVVGFELFADGTTSDFIVQADKFAIENGSGRPFEVVGGTTYIKNAVIQNGAVTNQAYSQVAAGIAKNNNAGGTTEIIGLPSFTSAGNLVQLQVSIKWEVSNNNGAVSTATLVLNRDGSPIATMGSVGGGTSATGVFTFTWIDVPGAGAHSYSVTTTGPTGTASTSMGFSNRMILALELKK